MGGITMRGKKFDCRYPGCNLWTLSLSGRWGILSAWEGRDTGTAPHFL